MLAFSLGYHLVNAVFDCVPVLLQYVSEAVAALAEVPLKTSDVPAAVDMAAALHARCGYAPAVRLLCSCELESHMCLHQWTWRQRCMQGAGAAALQLLQARHHQLKLATLPWENQEASGKGCAATVMHSRQGAADTASSGQRVVWCTRTC